MQQRNAWLKMMMMPMMINDVKAGGKHGDEEIEEGCGIHGLKSFSGF
jgi:hypothetical protein